MTPRAAAKRAATTPRAFAKPLVGPTPVGPTPVVAIIMGSDSDLPVMQSAADILTEFGVPIELHVVSAHRTPSEMLEYGRTAAKRGLRVIIAGAGGAATCPG